MSIKYCIATVALIVAATAYAQPTAPATSGPGAGQGPAKECRFQAGPRHGEGMGSNFFCPELVMWHQKYLGLTEDQETALRTAAVKFAAHTTDLQWQLGAEEGVMADLLKQDKLDEKVVLAEKEKVLKIEDDLKLANLAMLVEVKNTLTPEQQAKLTGMENRMGQMGHHWLGHRWMGHHLWDGRMMRPDGMGSRGGQLPANPQ